MCETTKEEALSLLNANLEEQNTILTKMNSFLQQENDRLAGVSVLRESLNVLFGEKNAILEKQIQNLRATLQDTTSHLEDVNRKLVERQDTRLDLGRTVWSPLCSERLEAMLHALFIGACQDVRRHYASSEIAITASLVAYLCRHAQAVTADIRRCIELENPGAQAYFSIEHIDCQKHKDVGGADLALVLDISIPDRIERVAFCAFQAKKIANDRLSLSDKEMDQLNRVLALTHASYYLLYPPIERQEAPSVVPARALKSYISAKRLRTLSRDEISAVSLAFCDYVKYDFIASWSGDTRRREDVAEFVENVLRPLNVLKISIGAATARDRADS